MESQYPHEIKNVTEEEDEIIKKYYKNYTRPFIRVGPEGYISMAAYGDHAVDIYNLEVRPDDVWVTSFSRSGTTWLQELVWLVANNLDYEAIKNYGVNNRFAYIEYPTQAAELNQPPAGCSKHATLEDHSTVSGVTSPRYIKSHLPLSPLPPKLVDTAKVFYIARDPRDVVVSFHFAHKLFRYFDDAVTLKGFWDLFQKDLIMHTPLFPHVKEAWDKRNHCHLMFLFYEDLQKDLLGVIEKVSAFLGKQYSAEQKQILAEHLNFKNMKKNHSLSGVFNSTQEEKTFFRKGQAGGWTEYFDEEMMREAEEFISKNLGKTDMQYPETK